MSRRSLRSSDGRRHGRRGGVPPDHVLARGGGAADHRRQHRPGHAALAADRARDDRPARARRLRRPRATTSRSSSPTTAATHAQAIVRRHRLIERFLTDVLGIPWDEVHEEAERLEHAMSPVLEERMLAAIGDATTCPHGHPIVEGARERGVAARRRRGRRRRSASCASRTRPRSSSTTSSRPACDPGLDGDARELRRRRGRASSPTTAATRSRAASPRPSRCAAEPAPAPRAPLPEPLVLSSDRYGR